MSNDNLEDVFNAGSWLGRKQAFSSMAGRCSAADAHCIRNLREEKAYKSFGMTWDEFCPKRMGMSRSMADRTIRLLEEFGESYFYLNGLTPISPEDYRLIAGAVSGEGVTLGDKLIPLAPQNAVELSAAVENLKGQARLALPAPEPKSKEKPAPVKRSKDRLWDATGKLQDVIGDLEKLLAGGPGQHDRATLMLVLGGCVSRLGRLDRSLRVK